MNKLFLTLSISLLLFTACKDINTFTLNDSQGTFVLNQGDSETSTLSRYDYEQKIVTNNLFKSKNNGNELGANVSVFKVKKTDKYTSGLGFFVFPERDEVEAMSMSTYGIIGNVDELSHPNDILIANSNWAYVSCGDGISEGDDDNVVTKVDIESFEVTDTRIKVGAGPDKLVSAGKYLYVANKMDGTVSIIDMTNDVLVETIEVGGYPFDMAVDIDLNIWVYCDGDAAGSNQSLYVISRVTGGDVLTHSVEERVTFLNQEDHGKNAIITSLDGRHLYFVHGKTHRMSVYESDYRGAMHDDSKYKDATLYSIAFESRTGKLQGLYKVDGSNGKLLVFDTKEDDHYLGQEYTVGINPIQIEYNY
ncbi:YncE family protein [Carboxylicivirga sp. N1Y90]|uniref:YncE family protein n=1 Tax=Carboxylicivirga fragile TaxID=3417571 RepID=UPI003D32A7D2|nr:hypothetical protein [Marinilabiliaceae bacterium N1Y90]